MTHVAPIVVEDGTGKVDADSYISVADADYYHDMLGNTAWTGPDTAKEHALRKATQYMQQVYFDRWDGYRKTSTQALDWPREYVEIKGLRYVEYVTSTTIPQEVKNACASLALRALTDDLLADEERAVISESVDVISVTYGEYSPQRKRYPEIERMLAKYLITSGGLQMVRV